MMLFITSDIRQHSWHLCDKLSSETWSEDHSLLSLLYAAYLLLQFDSSECRARQPGTLFHRLRMGDAYSTNFLHRINRADSPNSECGHRCESVEHPLLECVRYTSEQTVLRQSLAVLDRRPFQYLIF